VRQSTAIRSIAKAKMMFEEFLLMLIVVTLVLGFGACAALLVRNYRIADALFVSALVVAGSMLMASFGSLYACSASESARDVEHASAVIGISLAFADVAF
jgi:hypothetical protein